PTEPDVQVCTPRGYRRSNMYRTPRLPPLQPVGAYVPSAASLSASTHNAIWRAPVSRASSRDWRVNNCPSPRPWASEWTPSTYSSAGSPAVTGGLTHTNAEISPFRRANCKYLASNQGAVLR